jgi:hypothetical protein
MDYAIEHGQMTDGKFYVDLLIAIDPNEPDEGYSERYIFDTEAEANDRRASLYASIAYLSQQGLPFNEDNEATSGLPETAFMADLGDLILTRHEDAQAGKFLNIINTKSFDMTTIEY